MRTRRRSRPRASSAILESRQPAADLAVELVHNAVARHPRGQRVADDRGLLDPVEAFEQGQKTFQVEGKGVVGHVLSLQIMPLADEFQEILDALPSDWTDLELDLRVQEHRYVDAATLMVTANAQPYSNHDWHFHIIVAHRFGHAAAAPVVHGTLKLLDEAGIAGELALRDVRAGRVETQNTWGRPESWRREFRRIRAQ
jgi:hypothetical protein